MYATTKLVLWGMLTLQPVEVQNPDITAGVGCWLLQPEPAIEAVTLPETLVELTVPVTVPLIVQSEHDKPENGIENAPLAATLVVPATSEGTQLFRGIGNGTRPLST